MSVSEFLDSPLFLEENLNLWIVFKEKELNNFVEFFFVKKFILSNVYFLFFRIEFIAIIIPNFPYS
jgi:hypothetical protein